MTDVDLTDEDLQKIYVWIDNIPLSRLKKNIARDFSDGVLAAEVVAHYFPRLVDVHNYSAANSVSQKLYNWNTFHSKVLHKLGVQLTQKNIEDLTNCKQGAVEQFLYELQFKIAKYKESCRRASFSGSNSDVCYSKNGLQDIDKMRSAEGYAKKEKSQEDQQEIISIMEHKILRLEQLVEAKNIKIARLQELLNGNSKKSTKN